MKKKFFILGLFLAVGFLFLSNIPSAKAVTFTWTGKGDGASWTDCQNWDIFASNCSSFPGATTSPEVIINVATSSTPTIIYATSTINVNTLTLGGTDGMGPTLVIGNASTFTASSTVKVVGTSTLRLGDSSWGGGSLLRLAMNSGTPLILPSAAARFVPATSTVAYFGTSTGVTIATTTFYNLQLAPTSSPQTINYTFGGSGLGTPCTSGGCAATTTISNVLTMDSGTSATINNSALVLNDSTTSTTTTRFVNRGTFAFTGGYAAYSSTTKATNVAAGTYQNLTISGTPINTLLGNTTAASSTIISSGATLAVGANTLTLSNSGVNTFSNAGTLTIAASGVITATGATWTNTGTVTETGTGKITLASTDVITSSSGSGTSVTLFNFDSNPSVCITVNDPSLNFTTSADTIAVAQTSITAASGISSGAQTLALTETTGTSGVFSGCLHPTLSSSIVSGSLAYWGGGTLSWSFTDPQDSSDTGSGSGSFTGTRPGGGSSGGGGGGAAAAVTTVTTTTTVTPAPATVATTVTPTVTTPVAPTLDSVSVKVASVVAKIAALPASPAASDLVSIQAEITAILTELQTLQAAQTSTSGAALGYSFTKPLTYGLSNSEVTNLQEALKTDTAVYPEGKVTGYFGPATLKAVKAFQEKYGIATSDTPGYGRVGPATRAKLNELYGRSQ